MIVFRCFGRAKVGYLQDRTLGLRASDNGALEFVQLLLFDFAHCLNYKIATFRKLDSPPSSGKKMRKGQQTCLLSHLDRLTSDVVQNPASETF
jgi:hypothetical protein